MAAQVLEFELSGGIRDVAGLAAHHKEALVLMRFEGRPLGSVRVPLDNGIMRAADLRNAVEGSGDVTWRLAQASMSRWLCGDECKQPSPLTASIVICTRDRAADLGRCLASLARLAVTPLEIIVVDNAPTDDATARVVAEHGAMYVREDRPGLNWARARGARAALGDVVLFTDDDVVVDPAWVEAMLEPFSHPRVGAVTGLVMPLELETEAQELFEKYGGFTSRGYKRRSFDYMTLPPPAAGVCGAGASMAIRRTLIESLTLFDSELDCGTVAKTGGDNYAFYLLLVEGHRIIYNPEALVWHRHRREYAALRSTLAGYSVGGFAYLIRCWLLQGDWQALSIAWAWFKSDHLRQLWAAVRRKGGRMPFDLVWPQITGVFKAPFAYMASRRREKRYLTSIGAGANAASPLAAAPSRKASPPPSVDPSSSGVHGEMPSSVLEARP